MIIWITMHIYQFMFASPITEGSLQTVKLFGFVELFIEVAALSVLIVFSIGDYLTERSKK